jgi:hypothetical protein
VGVGEGRECFALMVVGCLRALAKSRGNCKGQNWAIHSWQEAVWSCEPGMWRERASNARAPSRTLFGKAGCARAGAQKASSAARTSQHRRGLDAKNTTAADAQPVGGARSLAVRSIRASSSDAMS